nr:hypothetical protein [uncultured Methanoregula sp.]
MGWGVGGGVCDLIIPGTGRTTIVRMVRTRHLRGSPVEMEMQLAGAAAGPRFIPPDPGRVYEIRACNYYRSLRFFYVGLVEIDRDGKPIGGTEGTGETPPASMARVRVST